MGEDVIHDYDLARTLSLLDITAIGVGAMIGAGIFVLTGVAAGVAGPAIILAFASQRDGYPGLVILSLEVCMLLALELILPSFLKLWEFHSSV
jgi:L-asparagine transporter-like permease